MSCGTRQAVELDRLVSAVQTRANEDRNFKTRTSAKSVAAWVHATNKIEFTGMAALGDTEAVIQAGTTGLAKASRAEREVLQTLDLIQRCYEPEILNHPKPATLLSVDLEKFKLFHQVLMANILSTSGQFRTFGAETSNGGSVHKYLHHSSIKMALTTLGYMLHRLMKGAEEIMSDPADVMLLAFAIASFGQFHFVDIHPFEDGNGRICRYLSRSLYHHIDSWTQPAST
ncbi:hypothetical protein HDU81_005860 [Chytriomyces hyalinus]|nr:hypothetical protein HDU81_005860 [Chytriomyces hyalinus]